MRHPALLFTIVIVTALVLGITLVSKSKSSGRTVTLTNGVVLHFEKITSGTNQTLTFGSPINKWARDHLPFARRWTGEYFQGRVFGERAELWIRVESTEERNNGAVPISDMKIVDQDGCLHRSYSMRGHGDYQGASIRSYGFQTFPYREAEVEITGLAGGAPFTIRMKNPRAGEAFPVWTTESLPATRKTNGLEITLKGIEVLRQKPGSWYFKPRFDLRAGGTNCSSLFTSSVDYRDATGNSGYEPCPHEPAWKVATTFRPTALFPFEPGSGVTLRGVKAPDAGEFIPLSKDLKVGRIDLIVRGLAGPGTYHFSNSVLVSSSPSRKSMGSSHSTSTHHGISVEMENFTLQNPTIILEVLTQRQLAELFVRVTPEQGNVIQARFTGSSGQRYRYEWNGKPGERSDVEFFSTQPFTLEWVIAPPPLPKDSPTSSR